MKTQCPDSEWIPRATQRLMGKCDPARSAAQFSLHCEQVDREWIFTHTVGSGVSRCAVLSKPVLGFKSRPIGLSRLRQGRAFHLYCENDKPELHQHRISIANEVFPPCASETITILLLLFRALTPALARRDEQLYSGWPRPSSFRKVGLSPSSDYRFPTGVHWERLPD